MSRWGRWGPVRPAALVLVSLLAAVGLAACDRAGEDEARRSATTTTAAVATTSTSTSTSTSISTFTSTSGAPQPQPPPPAARPTTLQGVVDEHAARQAVPFGVVAVDLSTGERATRLADRKVLSASFYKLFVARELLRRMYDGSLDRESQAGEGQGRTWGQCLTDMIVVSDDPCGVAGLKLVGRGGHDPALAQAGYRNTTLASPQQTSAADVALFFERAREGTLLGPGGEAPTKELWELLRRQQVRDRFPQGLPVGTPIAHKTGDRIGWAHDGGVFTMPAGRDVLLVAMTGQWASPCCKAERPGPAEVRAFAAIAGLARAVYDHLATR